MNNIYRHPERETWNRICLRPSIDQDGLERKVQRIIDRVRKKGDKAIRKYTKAFDGVKLKDFKVSSEKIELAAMQVSKELKEAIQLAKVNIETFHRMQAEKRIPVETMPGIVCWRKSLPIENIGIYIPGGSAPLFSTILMLAIPARLAGCKNIILCTPPGNKGIHPAILYTASICGVTTIYRIGGAQAIAAMAYGTETIPSVDKIFGPGNQYVTLAKQLIQKNVAIDMPAGPSELLVIADETAIPEWVASDLLSQAEHGEDSQVILVTTDESIAIKVNSAIRQQLDQLPREKIAKKALKNSRVIILGSLEEAMEFSNLYAPEHLILSCREAGAWGEKVSCAGSVFLGNYSPESAGDYASGTNHTLPTNGNARTYSGVSLDSFTKKITFQEITETGLYKIASAVMCMAEAEGLDGHKNAVSIRLKK